MPTMFRLAQDVDPAILDTMDRVLKKFPRFKPLVDNEVNIEVLFAYNEKGPAIKLAKCGVLAKIKVVGAEERARGGPDVRILVDGNKYAALGPKSRESMFAHELYHLELKYDERGLVRDDYGRPTLTTIANDWLINGFVQVAEWYGEHSIERRSYASVGELLGQQTLPFGDDDEPKPAKAKPERAAAKTKPRAAKRSKIKHGAKATPEATIRSIAEALAAFDDVDAREWWDTPLLSLDLSDLVIAALDRRGWSRVSEVLNYIEQGGFLDRIDGMNASRAEMLAEQLAESFSVWSHVKLNAAANSMEDEVAVAVKDVETAKPKPIADHFDSKFAAELDAATWREIPIDRLGLPVELVADAREYAIESAGALDAWLRSADSSDLRDETREAYIEALDAVEKPHRECNQCLFVRADGDACPRCRSVYWARTAGVPDAIDEVQAEAWRKAAERSDLDIYPDGSREPSKPGHLRIGSREVPVRGAISDDDEKLKRGRKAKAQATGSWRDTPIGHLGLSSDLTEDLRIRGYTDAGKIDAWLQTPDADKLAGYERASIVAAIDKARAAVGTLDDLYTVTHGRKKTPLYLVRAASLKEATDYVRGQHPATAPMKVQAAPLDFEARGYVIQDARKPAQAAAAM